MDTARRLVADGSWRASADRNGGKNDNPCRPFNRRPRRALAGPPSLSVPAESDGAAACDDALVSYDLAVWDGDRPLNDGQAGSTCDELFERYLDSDDVVVPPVPRIVAYVEALVARYPDDEGSGVWASPPVIEEASGPMVYLLMSYWP